MKVRIGEDFTRNLVQVWVYEQFADELRVGHVWKSGPSLQFDLFPPNVIVEPTYQIPHDVWDAIVREVRRAARGEDARGRVAEGAARDRDRARRQAVGGGDRMKWIVELRDGMGEREIEADTYHRTSEQTYVFYNNEDKPKVVAEFECNVVMAVIRKRDA